MPRGVTDQFLRILRAERRASLRTALAMLGLSAFAYFMAELTDGPLLGSVVVLAAVTLLVGLAAGILWGRHRTERYNESLRASWSAWMRMSLSCASVREVARHVESKGRAPPVGGVGWAALFLANALLFLFLWFDLGFALVFGVMVTTANGLVLGTLAGDALWSLRWTGQFAKALDVMIAQGQLGMWGEV